VTLLDLDLGRHQGGWGRIKYALEQLLKFPTIESSLNSQHVADLPKWNGDTPLLESSDGKSCLKFLESAGVFFTRLDLDFAMLRRFPVAYGVFEDQLEAPGGEVIVSVLGKSHGDVTQYSEQEQQYFGAYQRLFKVNSKPAAHIGALAQLSDPELNAEMPESIGRLLQLVKAKPLELPE
jgi:putative ATP-dependent endonuclease of OLD family